MLRPRALPAISLAAMLGAGAIAATAAAPAATGSGAFGPAAQAFALVALAAALYPARGRGPGRLAAVAPAARPGPQAHAPLGAADGRPELPPTGRPEPPGRGYRPGR